VRPEVQLENWRFISGEGFDTLLGIQYVGDTNAEIVVDDHNFAGGDGADGHRGATELDGELKLNIEEEIDVLLGLSITFVGGREFDGTDSGSIAEVFAEHGGNVGTAVALGGKGEGAFKVFFCGQSGFGFFSHHCQSWWRFRRPLSRR